MIIEQDTALAILCLNLEFSKRKQKPAPFRSIKKTVNEFFEVYMAIRM